VTGGIGPIPVSVSGTRDLVLGPTNSRSSWSKKEEGASCDRRQASHVTVVLSKAALSGPSVCLRARSSRAPCPLRVSCPGADRAKRAAKLQALAFRCLLGSRQVMSPNVQLTHGPGRTVALPYFIPRQFTLLCGPYRHLCLCAKHCGVLRALLCGLCRLCLCTKHCGV
jgi:hypothetical protein